MARANERSSSSTTLQTTVQRVEDSTPLELEPLFYTTAVLSNSAFS